MGSVDFLDKLVCICAILLLYRSPVLIIMNLDEINWDSIVSMSRKVFFFLRLYRCSLGVVGRGNGLLYALISSVVGSDSVSAIMISIVHELIMRRDRSRA